MGPSLAFCRRPKSPVGVHAPWVDKTSANTVGFALSSQCLCEASEAEFGITPMFFDHTFFCRAYDAMASSKTRPQSSEQPVVLSG